MRTRSSTPRADARRGASLVVTCEHGGNDVPSRYAACFARARGVLRTHRGYDIGALWLARSIAAGLDAPLVASTTSRLLVDLNRSPQSPELFSRYVRELSEGEREEILARHYAPHRRRAARAVSRALAAGRPVLHVAVHTFTPRLRGVERKADIGLLHDPERPGEAALSRLWREEIRRLAPKLRVRLNYPYRGWSDGLVTTFRAAYGPRSYLGLELEVSQRLLRRVDRRARRVATALRESLLASLARRGGSGCRP